MKNSHYHPIQDINRKIANYHVNISLSVGGRYLMISKDHFNSLQIRLPDCNFLLNELGSYLLRRLNVTKP